MSRRSLGGPAILFFACSKAPDIGNPTLGNWAQDADNAYVLLVFDGDCGFCTTSARWIEKRLADEVGVEPWQSLDLQSIGLTESDVTSAAWWIDDSGQPHRGHMAIGHALNSSHGVWRLVGRAIITPPVSWIARPAYWFVARYRYRLPGATDACRIPEAD